MSTNMKAELCVQTLDNAMASYPALRGTILHSDRGAQYTSDLYRRAITRYGIRQSMNRAGGRCHDNTRCGKYVGQNEDRITIRPLRPGTVNRGATEIAGLEILYELLGQPPHLLCQWRLTTHGETQ